MNTLTKTALIEAIANAAAARDSDDLRAIIRDTSKDAGRFALTDATVEMLARWGLSDDRIATFCALPVKAQKRAIEFAGAVSAKDFEKLDSVTAAGLCALSLVGECKTEALFYAATRKGSESTTDAIKGQTEGFAQIHKLIGRVGGTTAPTQISRSFGKSGFVRFFDACEGIAREGSLSLNKNSRMVRSVAGLIASATDGQLALIKSKKKGEVTE
jgi:hypothetical protein